MLPRLGARVVPAAQTRLFVSMLAGSALLHVGFLMMLWRVPPPPAPDTPPELALAFEATPTPPVVPTPLDEAQPVEPVTSEPPPPETIAPDLPTAEPPSPESTAPEPPAAAPPAHEPTPAASSSDPNPAPLRHTATITKAPPKPARPQPRAVPQPVASTPRAATPRPASPAIAEAPPVPAAPSAPTAPAIANPAWQTAVGGWLRAHKTYPDDARRNAEQGRVMVRFTVQRDGTVTAATLLQSSGSSTLDAAAERCSAARICRRSQPAWRKTSKASA